MSEHREVGTHLHHSAGMGISLFIVGAVFVQLWKLWVAIAVTTVLYAIAKKILT